MTDKKFHTYILTVSFVLCTFIYADTYLVPLKTNTEIITDIKNIWHQREANTYYAETGKHEYHIPPPAYYDLNKGDTLTIQRSVLTNSPQILSYAKNGTRYTSNIGFLQTAPGFVVTPVLMAAILLFFIFYEPVGNTQGKKNMTFLLLTLSAVLLLLHLRIFY